MTSDMQVELIGESIVRLLAMRRFRNVEAVRFYLDGLTFEVRFLADSNELVVLKGDECVYSELMCDGSTSSERVKTAFNACAAQAQLVPMQRTIGAGYAIQNITVVALPVDLWEELTVAIDQLGDGSGGG